MIDQIEQRRAAQDQDCQRRRENRQQGDQGQDTVPVNPAHAPGAAMQGSLQDGIHPFSHALP